MCWLACARRSKQARAALNLALGLSLQAVLTSPQPSDNHAQPGQDPLASISPGQKFTVQVKLHNGSTLPLQLRSLTLDGHVNEHLPSIAAGQDYQTDLQIQLPADAAPNRPALHRNDPERDAIYAVDDPRYQTAAVSSTAASGHRSIRCARTRFAVEPGCRIEKSFRRAGNFCAGVGVTLPTRKVSEQRRILAITPVFSVELEPGEQVIPIANGSERTVKVGVSSNLTGAPSGILHLEAPSGWRLSPGKFRWSCVSAAKKSTLNSK